MITTMGVAQIVLYLLILLAFVKPLGWYMAAVYEGRTCGLNRLVGPLERFIYRLCAIQPEQEMEWKSYLSAMLVLNGLGLLVVYGLQRLQAYLPLNPEAFPAVLPGLSFNTAVSFTTNTDWQSYVGESSLSYLTTLLGLTVQNFLSAATGMALLVALIRGLVRQETTALGNFWVDVIRGILYILLPLALVFAVVLSSQGVIQNFKPYQKVSALQSGTQIIPMGPVASQVAIKQLGTNGGGFFNANSAHPFENPTPLTNFLEMLAILLIPAALCYTFGIMTQDKWQGWALLITMLFIFIPLMSVTVLVEQKGNPLLGQMVALGGNMEGKEIRFGIVNSAFWAAATSATSNGSVNAMLDSFMPLGGLIPIWLMHLGEVVFGGVGSGLGGMLMFVILAVFMAGLMVGRTPEYLGKKIGPYEMKMTSIAVLIMPLIVLAFTAISVVTPAATGATGNPGMHGLSEILYAFTSLVNNNGSAFAGLNTDIPFYHVLGGIAMLMGRYWVAIPMLALAGSLARKKIVPSSAGTLSTHTPIFIFLLISVIMVLGALTFFPVLALGPIVEHLILWGHHGH